MNRQILPSSVLMRLRFHQPSELTSSHCRSSAHWPDNQPLLQGPRWGDQQRTSGPTKFELLHTKIILMENKVQLKNKREHVVGWLLLSPVLLIPPPLHPPRTTYQEHLAWSHQSFELSTQESPVVPLPTRQTMWNFGVLQFVLDTHQRHHPPPNLQCTPYVDEYAFQD
jgi:hypothetical protein